MAMDRAHAPFTDLPPEAALTAAKAGIERLFTTERLPEPDRKVSLRGTSCEGMADSGLRVQAVRLTRLGVHRGRVPRRAPDTSHRSAA